MIRSDTRHHLVRIRVSPILLWIIAQALALFTLPGLTSAQSGDLIDLRSADTVRVLLFELEQPNALTIFARDGSVTIRDGRRYRYQLNPEEAGLTIRRTGRSLQLRGAGRTRIAAAFTLLADEVGMIRIYSQATGYRYYRGSITLRPADKGSHLEVINTVSLENYIASVVGGEMNFEETEALKSQAVIARTYALWNLGRTRTDRYDLTDHTMSQVYKGVAIDKPRYLDAAMATFGEILTWSGDLILAAYSSTCGGVTSDNETVWNGAPLPYLRAVSDNGACDGSPHFRWTFELPAWKLHRLLRNHWGVTADSVAIEETDRYGKVVSLQPWHYGKKVGDAIPANKFRIALLNAFGSKTMKSTHFTLTKTGSHYHFSGQGLGHGVGLCQWGAQGFAREGWRYRDILKFYYNGVAVTDYHSLPEQTLQKAK